MNSNITFVNFHRNSKEIFLDVRFFMMLSCSLIQSKKIRHISEISHIEILIKELIEVRFVECTVN